jgi:hypothetical protein
MAQAKTLVGSRAKILINGQVVGLFTNCSWSIRQSKEPLFTLGRYSPGEIVPTSQEAVTVTLTGYRVVDSGPYKVANATLLKDLLNEEDFSIVILDRKTGLSLFTAVGCRVQGWSSGVASRGVSDIRLDVIALRGEDEYGASVGGDAESASAANIDDGA